jgi:SAM-dependent methyltransferase
MNASAAHNGRSTSSPWRGIDLSGVTVVLGVGTGRQIELLNQEIAASGGHLLVLAADRAQLGAVLPLRDHGPLTLIQGRIRQISVLSETVDLLVVNGLLREVPTRRLRAMAEELWRVLVPGGQLRISDIIEPTEAEDNHAWAERNRIVRKLADALERPTALSVDLPAAAAALQSAGFQDLGLSFLPGYALTDAWLEETVNAIRAMASRVVDRQLRHEIVEQDLSDLVGAYAAGQQRAPQRFVLQGSKPGDLALDMEASFTEEDLLDTED